jgi:HD-GYP domain-containing protein (c-di-GMP phosphodiesterase class II)
VPDAILLKAGPLDEAEFAAVREHSVLGARIVGDVLDVEQIAWIAGHHERTDGSGYPGALKGDAIPEGAALLALADAWDVMVSNRSYSPPMTLDAALAEAQARAGTQFAAAAVDALEALAAPGDLLPAAARVHQPSA